MKQLLFFDIEANGLLDTATEMWTVSSSILTYPDEVWNIDKLQTLAYPEIQAGSITDTLLSKEYILCGHNIIGYDMPLICKLFPDLQKDLQNMVVIDTLVWSKLNNPDRQLPDGCPKSIPNPVTGKSKRVTPHGLEAWGYRLGSRKLQVDDWTTYSEIMIERCESDVDINMKVFQQLFNESSTTMQELLEIT